MFHKKVLERVEEVGVIPAIRVSSAEDARFAAESILRGGIPIVEIALTVPGALQVIGDLANGVPDMIVGAGSVLDEETARLCVDAGAKFLTTDSLFLEVVKYAKSKDVAVFAGALTPTEVITAWRAGSDLVKVVPCAAAGGASYIRALKSSMPQIPLIAAGGVDQRTAGGFISAGVVAVGVGAALVPGDAIELRQSRRISELARRFVKFVLTAREENMAKLGKMPARVEARSKGLVEAYHR